MLSFGLDLAKSPAQALSEGLGTGLVYALLVVALAGLYFLQQRMVAARAAVSPTMSPAQQKLMQYLPVAFAIFQVFFLTGLIVYYMAQAVLRIGQQAYITRRFYGHEESLGRQAQRAGDEAREIAKQDGGGGGLFGQVKPKPADASPAPTGKKDAAPPPPGTTKRTTPPKGRPTPTGKAAAARPKSPSSRPGGSRAKSGGKRRR
jgi:YidC/Oxa1 family membrane protein insertase